MSKTIKVIDLLNKIANGEEVPEKVRYGGIIYKYSEKNKQCLKYVDEDEGDEYFRFLTTNSSDLNDTVEIIEEEPEIEEIDVSLLGDEDNWIRKYNLKKHIYEQYTGNELNPYIIHNIRENTIIFQNKINELIRAIKQIDKKLKGE